MKGLPKWLVTRVLAADARTLRLALAAAILALAAVGVLQAEDVQHVLRALGLSAL